MATPRQRAYQSWRQMVITAHRTNARLHSPWREQFEHFLKDMGDPPPNQVLRRRDSAGPFSPENCYWAP